MKNEVKESMKLVRECKHSVRYDSSAGTTSMGKPQTLAAVYLLKSAYYELNKPAEIEVTVKAKKGD